MYVVYPLLLALAAMMPQHASDTLAIALTFQPSGDSAAPVLARLTLPRGRDTVTLALPNTWAGRSKLYENIVGLHAVGAGAAILPTNDPSHVRFSRPKGSTAAVEWKLRATLPSSSSGDAHNHSDIGQGVAQLVGFDALVLPALDQDTPVRATLRFDSLPAGGPALTSFGVERRADGQADERTIVARTQLGSLREAVYLFPLERNVLRVATARVRGGALTIALRGHRLIPDSTLVDGIRRVVDAERGYWGGTPAPQYLVSVGVAPRDGLAGVRLTDAFIADIDSLRPAMDDRALWLVAHELMHEWIGGGATRPAPGAGDGQLSWFTEGFTDYAANRVLWRAGLETDSQYVATIDRALADQALSPARDMPWATVVATSWQDPLAERQPYLRGQLLALRLEGLMRAGPATLDTVLMRLVRESPAHGPGVTDSSLVRSFGAVIGVNRARAEVSQTMQGGVFSLPAPPLPGCADAVTEMLTPWDPGFDVETTVHTHIATSVRAGGPAERAGLRDGMRITRVDLYRNAPTKNIVLGVRDSTGDRTLTWLPAATDRVPVQQWRLIPGARCER